MGYWPDPTPFEAEDGSASSSLDDLIRGPGAALPGLLLLADPAAPGAHAARAAAIRLARAWVRTGRRTVLADLDLRDPRLHELLGVPNAEGVADHFAFGISFAHVTRPVEDGAWSFMPAGTWAWDPAEILGSPKWARLLREYADRDATLLAFVPADSPGVAALAGNFGAVLVLGAVPELPDIRPFSVLAAFELPGAAPGAPDETTDRLAAESEGPGVPPVAAAEPPLGSDTEPAISPPPVTTASERESADAAFERIRLPTDARAREALIADLRYRQRAARMAPPPDTYRRPSLADLDARGGARPPGGGAPSPAEPVEGTRAPSPTSASTALVLLGEPPMPDRRVDEARPRSYRPLWWTLAVVVLVSVLAGSWHVLRSRLARPEPEPAQPDSALEVPLRLPQAVPDLPAQAPAPDTVLAYTVSLGEHVRLPNAEQRLAALRNALPSAAFFVAPVVRDDALYYDVLAGPAADSSAAAALQDSLAAKRLGGDAPGGELRRAPYAFLLGEYATAEAAAARIGALRRLEIPSYQVAVAGPPARFRVYAGSYTGPVDAEVMKQILQSVGEPDVLVPRLGRR